MPSGFFKLRLKKFQWERQAISSAAFSVKASRTFSHSDRFKPVMKTLRGGVAPLQAQGITKPAIRRLARRGGVKRISGLIYEDMGDASCH